VEQIRVQLVFMRRASTPAAQSHAVHRPRALFEYQPVWDCDGTFNLAAPARAVSTPRCRTPELECTGLRSRDGLRQAVIACALHGFGICSAARRRRRLKSSRE
jgi:hypothetical protein